MKRTAWLVAVLSVVVTGASRAESLRLTIESFQPASFPRVSATIDADPEDQFEIARQASLFALSPSGWNLQELADRGNEIFTGPDEWKGGLIIQLPPRWTGPVISVNVYVSGNSPELLAAFGYELNDEALNGPQWEPSYGLIFHTDDWTERGDHDIGERLNNFGVISGAMSGTWTQTPVPEWGHFSTAPIRFVRGDANADGEISVSDGVRVLLHLFSGLVSDCPDALDANDDGDVTLTDAVGLLQFLFGRGLPPSPPLQRCGADPTPDALQCDLVEGACFSD